jgi:hypothetical protein
MRIFYSEGGDPMLLDGEDGLQALVRDLRAFVRGAATRAKFPVEVGGDPLPYSEFLVGLRVEKAAGLEPELRMADDRWLELTIAPQDLERLCSKLARVEDGGHTHLYAAPLALIFEADNSWSRGHEG